jgi:hypothetical protein
LPNHGQFTGRAPIGLMSPLPTRKAEGLRLPSAEFARAI